MFGFAIGIKIFLVSRHNTMLFLLINKKHYIKCLNSVIGNSIHLKVKASYWSHRKLFLSFYSNITTYTFNIYKCEILSLENRYMFIF